MDSDKPTVQEVAEEAIDALDDLLKDLAEAEDEWEYTFIEGYREELAYLRQALREANG